MALSTAKQRLKGALDMCARNNKRGFTLVELIVVLAILAVIAAVAVPTAFGAIEKAKRSADLASMEAYNSAIRMHATFLQSDPAAVASTQNTIQAAINAANMINGDKRIMSKGFCLSFKPATKDSIAYFVADGDVEVAKEKDWDTEIGLKYGKENIIFVK